MDENGDERSGDGTEEPAGGGVDGTEGPAGDGMDRTEALAGDRADRDADEADEAAGALGPNVPGAPSPAGAGPGPTHAPAAADPPHPPGGDTIGEPAYGLGRQPAPAGAWQRWTRPRPLVALAAVTVLLAVASFFLNRQQQRLERPERGATTRLSTSIRIMPGHCSLPADLPRSTDGRVVAYDCAELAPRPGLTSRGPVTPAARAAGLGPAKAINDLLDRLAVDCRTSRVRDPGCPVIVIALATDAAGPGGTSVTVVQHGPSAVTDAQVALAQRTLVAAGFRTVSVRRALPYDPVPPGQLLWSLETDGACVIGSRAAYGGGTYDVYGRLPSGTCLV
jgi:hypothetical protein